MRGVCRGKGQVGKETKQNKINKILTNQPTNHHMLIIYTWKINKDNNTIFSANRKSNNIRSAILDNFVRGGTIYNRPIGQFNIQQEAWWQSGLMR